MVNFYNVNLAISKQTGIEGKCNSDNITPPKNNSNKCQFNVGDESDRCSALLLKSLHVHVLSLLHAVGSLPASLT